MAVVTGVDHFGATVSDIERSLAFWRDLLGLEEVGRGVIEWEHIDRLVALPDTKLEWVELRVPGGTRVELLVDDLTAVMRELGAAGVRSRTAGPVDMERGAYAGGKGAYVFDPDGVQIELIERARPGAGEGRG